MIFSMLSIGKKFKEDIINICDYYINSFSFVMEISAGFLALIFLSYCAMQEINTHKLYMSFR